LDRQNIRAGVIDAVAMGQRLRIARSPIAIHGARRGDTATRESVAVASRYY